MKKGAIVLCGGRSTRMGRDKATLPFGPEAMLQRIVRLVNGAVEQRSIVVVAAAGQELPALDSEVTVIRDERPDRGPLEGLSAGLRHFQMVADAVYVTSCDAPLLTPRFVDRLFELLGDFEIVIPRDEQHLHPLAAVYRPTIQIAIQQLLDEDRLRMRDLMNRVRTREVQTSQLRDVDPELLSLRNLNSEADYLAALSIAGIAMSRQPEF